MYVCMCVYVYIFMYVYIHIYIGGICDKVCGGHTGRADAAEPGGVAGGKQGLRSEKSEWDAGCSARGGGSKAASAGGGALGYLSERLREIQVCVRAYVCMSVSMYVCMSVCMYKYIYTYA